MATSLVLNVVNILVSINFTSLASELTVFVNFSTLLISKSRYVIKIKSYLKMLSANRVKHSKR